MTLAEALLLVPPGAYLRCGREQNTASGEVFGSASLYAETPEGGWPEVRHPADKFLDRIIVSVSTDARDVGAFEHLVVHMIVGEYGTAQQLLEAREALEQRARTTALARHLRECWEIVAEGNPVKAIVHWLREGGHVDIDDETAKICADLMEKGQRTP